MVVRKQTAPGRSLQTDWVIPKSHFGVYAEIEKITFPLTLCVTAKSGNLQLYRRKFEINEPKEQTEAYTAECSEYSINLKCIVKEVAGLPGDILVKIKPQEWEYQEQVICAYARLHGRITDFDGNPFPAPLLLSRIRFADAPYMSVCDRNGEYSVVVPTGFYNTFYVDDYSYGKSALENRNWHMSIDRIFSVHKETGDAAKALRSVPCSRPLTPFSGSGMHIALKKLRYLQENTIFSGIITEGNAAAKNVRFPHTASCAESYYQMPVAASVRFYR